MTIHVWPGADLQACDVLVPGDISSAAFFMTAAAIVPNSDLTLTQVNLNPTRTGIVKVLEKMSARLEITAPEHDKAVAQISHLPHIIAAGLVNQTEETFKGASVGMRLAAGGFKSITRIASSDLTMWSQILLTNSADILQPLAEYQQVLDQLAQKIKDRDEAALYQYFAAAKSSRDQLGPGRSWPAIFRKLGKTNR